MCASEHVPFGVHSRLSLRRLYDVYPVVEMVYTKRDEAYGALGAYIVSGLRPRPSVLLFKPRSLLYRTETIQRGPGLPILNPSSCATTPA